MSRLGKALAHAYGKSIDPGDWPWSGAPPDSWLSGGGWLSPDRAVGLPVLLGILRLLSNGLGMSTMLVYQGDDQQRDRAKTAWQYDLLHRRPTADGDPFSWRADIALGLAGSGNAYLRKWKSSRGQVGELEVLDPLKVHPRRTPLGVVFDDSSGGGTPITRTKADIVHLRLGAQRGQVKGMAPVTEMRLAVSAALKRQVFDSAFWDQRAQPGLVIVAQERLDEQQSRELRDSFDAVHRGVENFHRTAVLGGGSKLETIPISLADAQFVEARRATREEQCGAYSVPVELLGDTAQRIQPDVDQRFAKFGLGPLIFALDMGLMSDQDLFPRGGDLFVQSTPDAILRMSLKDRADAYRIMRQAGVETANEIRPLEGLPPHPDGDVLQPVPVGGSPHGVPDPTQGGQQ